MDGQAGAQANDPGGRIGTQVAQRLRNVEPDAGPDVSRLGSAAMEAQHLVGLMDTLAARAQRLEAAVSGTSDPKKPGGEEKPITGCALDSLQASHSEIAHQIERIHGSLNDLERLVG